MQFTIAFLYAVLALPQLIGAPNNPETYKLDLAKIPAGNHQTACLAAGGVDVFLAGKCGEFSAKPMGRYEWAVSSLPSRQPMVFLFQHVHDPFTPDVGVKGFQAYLQSDPGYEHDPPYGTCWGFNDKGPVTWYFGPGWTTNYFPIPRFVSTGVEYRPENRITHCEVVGTAYKIAVTQ